MESRLKVLHLGSPSGMYGAERWIVSLITYLDSSKVESLIGVVNDRNYTDIPLCRVAEDRGIPCLILDFYGKANWAAVQALRQYIVENQIDIIHTHFYKTDLLGLFAARGTQCKVVSTPHGFASKPSFGLWLNENIGKLAFPMMDAVVPLSTALRRTLSKIPGVRNKLHLIENAVDIQEASADREVAQDLVELRNQGKFILGYIGRLEPGKDLETLLRAMACADGSNWHVALVGEGDHGEELKRLMVELGIEERVSFYGFREDRFSFLKGFDVFVLPSRSEGIPRCLMESMAAGIPIIATDIPGCRNLVDGTTTGLLFAVGDVSQLRQQIADLQSSKSKRSALTEDARKYVESRFSCSRMAKEYENLYRKLIPVQEGR